MALFVRDAHQAHAIAQLIQGSNFVPRAIRNRPDEITATFLVGAELGLSPMAALRSIDIIEGTPAMRALTMRALVQRHGHQIWVEESTAHRAIVCARRVGSTHTERCVWDMDRARRLGLANKKNYRENPNAMFVARATAEACRLVAADALLGMPYAAEELDDERVVPDATGEPKRGRRVLQRAPVKAESGDGADEQTTSAPPLEPAATPPEQVDERVVQDERAVDSVEQIDNAGGDEGGGGARGVTAAQLRRMHASFGELGVSEREARLAFVSRVVGRDISSSADLDVFEASAVIEALHAASQGAST